MEEAIMLAKLSALSSSVPFLLALGYSLYRLVGKITQFEIYKR